MQLSQRVEIPVARESVWLALNDHKILMQCLPGCEQFEPSEENCFTIVLLAKVGPVKARFSSESVWPGSGPDLASIWAGSGPDRGQIGAGSGPGLARHRDEIWAGCELKN